MKREEATFEECQQAVRRILKRERENASAGGNPVDGSVGTFVYDDYVYLHTETEHGLYVTTRLAPGVAINLGEILIRRATKIMEG